MKAGDKSTCSIIFHIIPLGLKFCDVVIPESTLCLNRIRSQRSLYRELISEFCRHLEDAHRV